MARWRRLVGTVGLGLVVGAVLHATASAQDTTRARRDTIRRDSTTVKIPARPTSDSLLRDTLAKRDSLRGKTAVPKDTMKAPYARAPMPVPLEIGGSYSWDRAGLMATGAITVQDLLDRVPGIVGLRAGWISAPMVSAYFGDARRVRLFYDGLELDEIDPRTGGVFDLTEVQLWTLEELRIERGATEVRVYMRSWRVDRTTPYTRTDISSGDQSTNLYRGFFGRRWPSGFGLQLAAQQYGTTPPLRGSPSSDQLSVLGRIGWAAGRFSLDAFAIHNGRNRGTLIGRNVFGGILTDSIAGLQSSRTDAYVRAAYGDPESGPWVQVMAGGLSYSIQHNAPEVSTTTGVTETTKADTSPYRAQYVIAAGYTKLGLRLEASERYRMSNLKGLSTPSARAEFVSGPLSISALAEARGPDSLANLGVVARLAPLSFLSFLGAVGRSQDFIGGPGDTTVLTNFARAEAGIRIHGLWFTGGVIYRDSTRLAAPVVFDTSLSQVNAPASTGETAAIRGTFYQALKANILAVHWNDTAGFYRPQWQVRGEIFVATNWLSRFPSGNFGVMASFVDDYRSSTRFPTTLNGQLLPTVVSGWQTQNFLLEFKIVNAILSYQFRNIQGLPYQIVPNFLMPRQTQFYGVRWEFWN